MAWSTFGIGLGKIPLKINTVTKKSYHKGIYFCDWSMGGHSIPIFELGWISYNRFLKEHLWNLGRP